MTLHRQILFAAKAAAIRHQLHTYFCQRQAQELGNLFLVFVNALAL